MRGRRPSASANFCDQFGCACDVADLSDFVAVDPGDGTDLGLVAPVDLLQRIGDLADGGLGPRRVDGQRQQVVAQPVLTARPWHRGPVNSASAASTAASSRSARSCSQLGDLLGAHPAVLDLEHLDLVVLVDLVLVDADHRLLAGVDAGLGARGRLLDAQLRDAVVDGLRHAAVLGHLGDVRAGPLGELMGQPLHVVRAAPRVDRPGGARLLLQQQLGVAGDAGREVGGQRQRLVEGVGVQRLGVPLGRGHRLDAGAGDVVERRPARSATSPRSANGCAATAISRSSGSNCADQFAPQQPTGPQLGDLHEEVHPDAPEERQPRRELVDVQARRPGPP